MHFEHLLLGPERAVIAECSARSATGKKPSELFFVIWRTRLDV
jgi:hypothetical protein